MYFIQERNKKECLINDYDFYGDTGGFISWNLLLDIREFPFRYILDYEVPWMCKRYVARVCYIFNVISSSVDYTEISQCTKGSL